MAIATILGDVVNLPTPPKRPYSLAHRPIPRLHIIAQDASKGVGAPLTSKTHLHAIQRLWSVSGAIVTIGTVMCDGGVSLVTM